MSPWFRWGTVVLLSFAMSVVLGGSNAPELERSDQVRRFTRQLEFDYIGWTTESLTQKLRYSALSAANYLSEAERKELVLDYVELIGETARLRGELEATLSNPAAADPQEAAGSGAAGRHESCGRPPVRF